MNEPEKPVTTSFILSGFTVDITEGLTEDQVTLAWANYCDCPWNTRFL